MSIKEFSIEDLKKELDARARASELEVRQSLIIAVTGIDGGRQFTEVLVEVKKASDLPNMDNLRLRARFNSHRHYKLHSFKCDSYDEINKACNEDNEAFTEWINDCDSIKTERL